MKKNKTGNYTAKTLSENSKSNKELINIIRNINNDTILTKLIVLLKK